MYGWVLVILTEEEIRSCQHWMRQLPLLLPMNQDCVPTSLMALIVEAYIHRGRTKRPDIAPSQNFLLE